jgi:mRNA interferase RelE/StbE
LAWKVEVSETAARQIAKLDKTVQRRITKFLHERIEGERDPRLHGKSLAGEWRGLWRYRVGDYRLFCDIRDDIVTVLVLYVGHRREVYR